MRCRLCSGHLTETFRLKVLEKYDTQYLTCADCKSLQTEPPHWLGEAYSINLSDLDTGAVQRNVENLIAAFITCRLLNLTDVVDVGGGDGLFCRLMRDHGLNCFVSDQYAKPTYAQGFTVANFKRPQLATAFEILEHFANPSKDLEAVFDLGADVVLVSTSIFDSQGSDWWYLGPESGQHVFFYSSQSLDWISRKFDYTHFKSGGFVVFTRTGLVKSSKSNILQFLLRSRLRRMLRAILAYLPTPGVWDDHLHIRQARKQRADR